MSYRYYAPKRNPVSMWLLDDTTPFQEYGGLGYAAATVSGSGAPTKHASLVAGAEWASVFSNTKRAEFTTPVFQQGQEERSFALEAWLLVVPKSTTSPQKVLSHSGFYDGITIEGTLVKFSTMYLTAAAAVCSYDLKTTRAAHVVAVHTKDENLLYVDNVLVSQLKLTNEQKNDSFVATNGKLYAGESTSNQEIALNGIATYVNFPPEGIAQNFDAGRRVVPQNQIYPQFQGQGFDLNSDTGSVFLDYAWENEVDFKRGYVLDTAVGTSAVYPKYVSGVSVAGSWTAGLSLDGNGQTDIYGVMVEWSAYDVTVEGSLDGTTWTALTNGKLVPMIANHANPTGLDLQVRFSFDGGLSEDPAFVEYVRIVGYVNNTVNNSQLRPITLTHPAVLRGNYEPIEYRSDNGVTLWGGTITMGADPTGTPQIYRTVEFWIKPDADYTASGGTTYINGLTGTVAPAGQWSLVHVVLASDSNTNYVLTGNYTIGQFTFYPTALVAADVLYIYQSYVGRPVIQVNDTSSLTISEPVNPVNIYSHSWSIEGAGG